ncbi:MAG: hypothetical protein CMP59_00640 [Flavobacteriales bacterium]|nr:hypothetical protein [Flavobacteriales bacterium]
MNWLKETYRNPDEVIKSSIDNEMIRFEGYQESFVCIESMMTVCYNGSYTIRIDFKDGRFKFEPVRLIFNIPPSQNSAARDTELSLSDGSYMYKNNGKLRSMYSRYPNDVPELFNELIRSLLSYIEKGNEQSSNDDW